MKTGTTYLQQLMYANRERLADAGVHLPGDHWTRQLRAAQNLMSRGRLDPHIRTSSRGAWDRLAHEARSTSLPVAVISVEFLGSATSRQVTRAVASLSPAEVRVVFTLRDMAAVLPALWQTEVHNGARYSWPEFLRRIEYPSLLPLPSLLRRRPEDVFASTQDVSAMIATWGEAVGGNHLRVVTVPRGAGDAAELWRRFASVIQIDPAVLVPPVERSNTSIGLAATELVRRVNRHIGRLPTSEYNSTVKDELVMKVLAANAGREGRAQLSLSGYDLALRWNAEVRRAVLASGAAVTGDLADLPTEPDPGVRDRLGVTPRPASRRRMLDDAQLAAKALIRLRRRRTRRLQRLGAAVEPPPASNARRLRRAWEQAPDPIEAAALDLAESARQAALELRRLRRAGRGDGVRPAGRLKR
jgi:hypothetical protein